MPDEIFRALAEEARLVASFYDGQAKAFQRVVEMGAIIPSSPTQPSQPHRPQATALPNRRQPQRAILEVLRRSDTPLLIGEIVQAAMPLGYDLNRSQVTEVLKRITGKGWIIKQGAAYLIDTRHLQEIISRLENPGDELEI